MLLPASASYWIFQVLLIIVSVLTLQSKSRRVGLSFEFDPYAISLIIALNYVCHSFKVMLRAMEYITNNRNRCKSKQISTKFNAILHLPQCNLQMLRWSIN